MKKLIMLIMTVLLVCALVCGCGKAGSDPTDGGSVVEENKGPTDEEIKDAIVGAWIGVDSDGQKLGYIFNEDGTGFAAIFPITYTVEKGILTITIEAFGETQTASAAYDIDGDTLTVVNAEGEEYVLTRTEMPELD